MVVGANDTPPQDEVSIRRRLFTLRSRDGLSREEQEEVEALFANLVATEAATLSLFSVAESLEWPPGAADLLARRLAEQYRNDSKADDSFMPTLVLRLPGDQVSKEAYVRVLACLASHGYPYDLTADTQTIPWSVVRIASRARKKGVEIEFIMEQIELAQNAARAAREAHVGRIEEQRLTRLGREIKQMEDRLSIRLPPPLLRRWVLDQEVEGDSPFLAPDEAQIVEQDGTRYFIFGAEPTRDAPYQQVRFEPLSFERQPPRRPLRRRFFGLRCDSIGANGHPIPVVAFRGIGEVVDAFEYDGYEVCRYWLKEPNPEQASLSLVDWIASVAP